MRGRRTRPCARLTTSSLERPVEAAHGWSGRDLMAHLLAWQSVALAAARELAVDETSATIARADADWEARGGEVINAELTADLGGPPDDGAAGSLRQRARRAARVR